MLIAISESRRPRRNSVRYPVNAGSKARIGIAALTCAAVLVPLLAPTCASATSFTQTNLASDIPGLAAFLDPNLQNPWGMAFSITSPFWISDQGTNVATLYQGTGAQVPLVVSTPPGPTGIVFNSTGSSTSFVVSSGAQLGPATFLSRRFLDTSPGGTLRSLLLLFRQQWLRQDSSPPMARFTQDWPSATMVLATFYTPPTFVMRKSTCSTPASSRFHSAALSLIPTCRPATRLIIFKPSTANYTSRMRRLIPRLVRHRRRPTRAS
jgi:hypothetical protein